MPGTVKSNPPTDGSLVGELGSESGMTPLHLAAYSANENVVRLLLNSAGVQVIRSNDYKNRPDVPQSQIFSRKFNLKSIRKMAIRFNRMTLKLNLISQKKIACYTASRIFKRQRDRHIFTNNFTNKYCMNFEFLSPTLVVNDVAIIGVQSHIYKSIVNSSFRNFI